MPLIAVLHKIFQGGDDGAMTVQVASDNKTHNLTMYYVRL